ncbi:hypothetical protein [uncultured Alistipes sp.]|uniref:hypothetical protein n=1 Tax=uncultured Alistipes sp. TaxID=538949 RepID=UPI0025DD34F2|nr:hypothetical protein [uncultured Alistipes sp.]
MSILTGLLTINGVDVYERFGAFLAEKAEDEHRNYDALLAMPALKKQAEVSIREEDGVRTAPELVQAFEPRDLTLTFAIEAGSDADFLRRYYSFVQFLKRGDKGWLDIRLMDIGLAFRVYLKGAGSYSQLTPFGAASVVALFEVQLREPQPMFTPVQTTI